MKRLVLAVAIVFGGLTTFATSVYSTSLINTVITVQDEFTEIDPDDLPQAVKDALAADFPSATLDRAYVNDAQQYRLEIIVDGAASTIYADEEGNWIDKE